MFIADGSLILFQGDSITDAHRNFEDDSYLGIGYANMIASLLGANYPEKKLEFLNKGISGNRAIDLVHRWDKDCIDLKPDLVSILIGVNDCWRRYDSNDPTSAEDFEKHYRQLLEAIKEKSDAKIVLCEPFLLSVSEYIRSFREDLDPKIHVVRNLALEYGALYVPFDGIFAAASTRREPEFWAADGVHPSREGHALMAQTWIKSVGL